MSVASTDCPPTTATPFSVRLPAAGSAPIFTATKLFVPTLLILSAIKFTIVVMFYMHLKYDAKLFRALFVGPLTMACFTIVGLLFLFGHLKIHF